MKRLVIYFAVLCMLMSLPACTQPQDTENSVNFYYPRVEYTSGAADSVIFTEIREPASTVLGDLLNVYLAGPKSSELQNPFPNGTKLTQMNQNEATMHIILSDDFASLSGVKLTLACCCLAQTVLSLTDVDFVEISAETASLDGKLSITMDRTSFSFLDDSPAVYQTNSTN